jgi:hypothetical protein
VRFSSFGILSHILGRDSRRVIIVHLPFTNCKGTPFLLQVYSNCLIFQGLN